MCIRLLEYLVEVDRRKAAAAGISPTSFVDEPKRAASDD
jgi:hypothetical protein